MTQPNLPHSAGAVALKRHTPLALLAAALVLAADQATKWLALQALADGSVVAIVWTLRLRLVYNTGAAFSIFEEWGPVLGVLAAVIAVVLVSSRRLVAQMPSAVATGCVAGGALGNLADRVFRESNSLLGGAVIDFIDVQWWPVWNVADMGVVLGACALGWFSTQQSRPSPSEAPVEPQDVSEAPVEPGTPVEPQDVGE